MLTEKKIYKSGGQQSVCVSHCLSFFGINPSQYQYTSSRKNRHAYINVLRRFGYSVRSRKTEFKVKVGTTMTQLKQAIRRSNYNAMDKFIVCGYQRKAAHLMVIDGNGNIVVDTAKGMKWKIELISIVEK